MNTRQIITALEMSLSVSPPNVEEIGTAIAALRRNSPVALKRASRALSRAVAEGRMDFIPEERREFVMEVIANLADDRGGRLPENDGKTAQMQIRVEPERKKLYSQAAAQSGLPLSGWVVEVCDAAAVEITSKTEKQ